MAAITTEMVTTSTYPVHMQRIKKIFRIRFYHKPKPMNRP